jgi:hypothetical protein
MIIKMNQELLEAYSKTKFVVFNSEIVIEIGKRNFLVEELLAEKGFNCSAFITAFNPFSQILTDDENHNRHLELLSLVKDYIVFEGEGRGEDATWKPEKSLLILGISRENARNLGTYFEQNAIVFGEMENCFELLVLH